MLGRCCGGGAGVAGEGVRGWKGIGRLHSTPSALSVTWFCKGGWGGGGLDQGCRLFLGYIQSNWKDEKWQSHKGPQSRAADSEHIITRVPGERAVRRLPAGRASALASCEPVRLTGKPIGVYIENKKKNKNKKTEKWDRRPLPRLTACFFFFFFIKERMVSGLTPAEMWRALRID